jgi:hypothetical protein
MGEERKLYKVLVGKPKGKRPLRRPRHRWEDGIRMDLGEIGLWGVDRNYVVLYILTVTFLDSRRDDKRL